MNTYYFTIFLFSNIPTYILSLFICILVFLPIIIRYTHGPSDPLFYNLIMATLANTIPLFLYFTKIISINVFMYILFAESLFWIGFSIFAKRKFKFKNIILIDNYNSLRKLFFLFLFLYISLKVLLYSVVGIPAFMNSRLEMYQGAVGMGVIERLISFPAFYCLVYSFYIFDNYKNKLWGYLTIIIYIIFSLLSGSKGSILLILFSYFAYSYIYKGKALSFKRLLKFAPLLIVFACITLVVQSDNLTFNSAFSELIIRFIANGDVYYMSLPDLINYVKIDNRFTFYFANILWPMRLVDLNKIDTAVGFQLTWMLDEGLKGQLFGPNTRNPILGWIFFKWGGIIFCFFQGLLTSFLMYRPSRSLPKGLLTCAYTGYVYNLMTNFIVDSSLGWSSVFDILLNTFIIMITYFLVNGPYIKIYKRVNT